MLIVMTTTAVSVSMGPSSLAPRVREQGRCQSWESILAAGPLMAHLGILRWVLDLRWIDRHHKQPARSTSGVRNGWTSWSVAAAASAQAEAPDGWSLLTMQRCGKRAAPLVRRNRSADSA